MRAYYLWNGGSPHDVDHISAEDAATMWKMYQAGMVGPTVNYYAAYNNYAMLNAVAQSGSRSRKKALPFNEVFKAQSDIIHLQDPSRPQPLSANFLSKLAPKGWSKKCQNSKED